MGVLTTREAQLQNTDCLLSWRHNNGMSSRLISGLQKLYIILHCRLKTHLLILHEKRKSLIAFFFFFFLNGAFEAVQHN